MKSEKSDSPYRDDNENENSGGGSHAAVTDRAWEPDLLPSELFVFKGVISSDAITLLMSAKARHQMMWWGDHTIPRQEEISLRLTQLN